MNIENLGDNLKNLHEEVAHWRQPEVEEAEMELQDLVKEIDLNPAKAGPSSIPQENLAPRPNVPDSVMISEAEETDMQRRFQALRSPLEVSPASNPQSASPIFTFGSTGQ